MGLQLPLSSQSLLVSGRFFGKWFSAWVRLGPLSMSEALSIFTHTDGSRRLSRRRSPNRAAWRFPDWTAVGFRFQARPLWHLCLENRTLFRSPFLGSANPSPIITDGSNLLGRMPRLKEEFLLA